MSMLLAQRPAVTAVPLLVTVLGAAILSIMAQPAAATGQPVLLGIYRPELPNDLSIYTSYRNDSGQRVAIVHWFSLWGGWKGAFDRADLDVVAAQGAIPMVTWEPWSGRSSDPEWSLRGAVLSGKNDDYIEAWANGLAAFGSPALLRFAHEMHDQTYPWAVGVNDNTAEDYVAAWRYVHGFFERAGATNVQWVWNPNIVGDQPEAAYEARYRALYPGDAYVDWLGLDVYNTGADVDWGAPYWRSFAQVLDSPYRAITRLADKPVILPEVGCTEAGGSKATWIAEALGPQLSARFPRVSAVVWFDVSKEANWALNSSSDSMQAWNGAARQSGLAASATLPN